MNSVSLHIYEEIGLLALRDQKGTFATERIEFLVAGAALAELLLDGFITVDGEEKGRVAVSAGAGMGAEMKSGPDDPILAACYAEIAAADHPHALQDWVERLARIDDLRTRVATRLCEREILRADEKTVLLIFSRKVYPEVSHEAEQRVLDRLRAALFARDADADVDLRTAVLITLAEAGDLLREPFGRAELREVEARIATIVSGQRVGRATRDAIAAHESAVVAALMISDIPMHGW